MNTKSQVWVVDDDRSIRWVLEKALSQAGIENQTFSDGDTLLQRMTTEQPSVIISDIRMPGIDGIELLSQLNAAYPKLPIIITTAHSDLDSAVNSYQKGAFEYLPKPFDIDEVVDLFISNYRFKAIFMMLKLIYRHPFLSLIQIFFKLKRKF